MKRLRLLLLDANVVIHLFELRLWEVVVEHCEVVLARTVVEESHFYEDEDGQRQDFDLATYEADGRIRVEEVGAEQIQNLRQLFHPGYLERLDAGEAESLALLMQSHDPYLFCAADSIVSKALVNLQREEQAISLEEVLQKVGFARKLRYQFSREAQQKWIRQGQADMIQGRGIRRIP
jgi:hypothetical protein